MTCGNNKIGCGKSDCPDEFGCPAGVCPDFTIRRNDTRPIFKVSVTDCDGPLDLTEDNLVLEVTMWAKAKLKVAIDADDTTIQFADNIGFQQVAEDDKLETIRVRNPERMTVTGFDEAEYTIDVTRGVDSTTADSWKKGTKLKIFRIEGATGAIESVLEDIPQVDGSVLEDQLIETFLTYEFTEEDTALPGCYWLVFTLTKLDEDDSVEWTRQFPVNQEGFLIKITDTSG